MRTMVHLLFFMLPFHASARTAFAAQEIAAPRQINRDTLLVSSGQAPAIVVPAGKEFKSIARRLHASLATRLGVKPDPTSTLEGAQPGKRTIIAIGNMLSNRLITQLYFNGYSCEDSLCPADKAYVIRVAYNPYPWRGGNSVIILGCETPAGADRAVADFLSRLQGDQRETFLPYTLVVSDDAMPHTRVGSPANRYEPMIELPAAGKGKELMACADAYLRTGKKEAARRAVVSLKAWVQWQKENPDANLYNTAWVKEFEFFQAVLPFEYCPLMTDELRVDLARIVLKYADDMWHHRKGYPSGKGVGPTWNHNTEPLMGAYLAGRYLLHYYGIERCREYIETAKECFIWQNKSWRSAEDSSSYITYASLSGMRWALMEWDLEFFKSGLARNHVGFIFDVGFRMNSWPENRQRMIDGRTFLAEREIPESNDAELSEDTTKRFIIQSADRVNMFAHNEWVDRLRRNRMYIRQRRQAKLLQGESRSFASILVPTAPGRRGAYEIHRIGPRAFFISGDEPALIAFGKFREFGITVDADCIMISSVELAGAGVRNCEVGGLELAGGNVHVSLTGNAKAASTVETALADIADMCSHEKETASSFTEVGFPLAGAPTSPLWQAEFENNGDAITRICVADLKADGDPEILVTRGSILYCFASDASEKWRLQDRRQFNDVTVGQLRPGREPHVVAGGWGKYWSVR